MASRPTETRNGARNSAERQPALGPDVTAKISRRSPAEGITDERDIGEKDANSLVRTDTPGRSNVWNFSLVVRCCPASRRRELGTRKKHMKDAGTVAHAISQNTQRQDAHWTSMAPTNNPTTEGTVSRETLREIQTHVLIPMVPLAPNTPIALTCSCGSGKIFMIKLRAEGMVSAAAASNFCVSPCSSQIATQPTAS
jgi:hypothetical protein